MANAEGPVSAKVTDSAKFKCHVCNSSRIQLTMLGDEPEDIADDADWWATIAVENATKRSCSVGLCHCGREQILQVFLWDTANADGSTTPALTNLDATTANGLAGWWWCVLQGTDIGKYVRIASNTVATPTVCTLDYLTNADGNGWVLITNVEPVGMTKIVA